MSERKKGGGYTVDVFVGVIPMGHAPDCPNHPDNARRRISGDGNQRGLGGHTLDPDEMACSWCGLVFREWSALAKCPGVPPVEGGALA